MTSRPVEGSLGASGGSEALRIENDPLPPSRVAYVECAIAEWVERDKSVLVTVTPGGEAEIETSDIASVGIPESQQVVRAIARAALESGASLSLALGVRLAYRAIDSAIRFSVGALGYPVQVWTLDERGLEPVLVDDVARELTEWDRSWLRPD